MFICKKCKRQNVPHRDNRRECRKCEQAYVKEWKKKYPEKQKRYNEISNASPGAKETKRQNKIDRHIKDNHLKKLCVEYKGGKCQMEPQCYYPIVDGVIPCMATFQFHHLDRATKKFGITSRIRGDISDALIRKIQTIEDLKKFYPDLIAELDKCQLLCGNCHAYVEYCQDCKRDIKQAKVPVDLFA